MNVWSFIIVIIVVGIWLFCRWAENYEEPHTEDRKEDTELHRLRGNFAANGEHIKARIHSIEGHREIYTKYAEDFAYVFGEDWINKLYLPPITDDVINIWHGRPDLETDSFVIKRCELSKYSFFDKSNHIYWIYRLMLADEGWVERDMIEKGYRAWNETDMRFIKRIAIRFKLRHPEENFVIHKNASNVTDVVKFESLVPWCNREKLL